MQTGHDILQSCETSAHVKAVVTGATSIFTKDLCTAMFALQSITQTEDMQKLAQACACHLLKSEKAAKLEQIVTAVIESEDGMPDIEDKHLLAEVLAIYPQAAEAEQSGVASAFRREVLVPDIVQRAFDAVTPDEPDKESIVADLDKLSNEWDSFEPVTPFQKIVVDCINRIGT